MTHRDETPAALTFLAPNSRPSTDSGQLLQQQLAVMGVRLTLNNAEHRGRLRRGRLHQVDYW
ncbi:hypothetical protein [Kutzneria sp. NPDC051319]|uniref:hypothetical protein n=1 Tax=Kutzneria sp. NPDC051319 TaxID=3155047 RepID=UPI00342B877B